MYRAATLAALEAGLDIHNEGAVVALVNELTLDILPPNESGDGRLYTVLMDGRDVTWDIRAPDVDRHVSQVSTYGGVRRNLVQRQRDIARRGKMVVVGRDIGTVVLPNAPLKLYIVASAEERARRRWQERRRVDETASYDQILADIVRRDQIDGGRLYSPMRPASDAFKIDTTGLTPEEVLDHILELLTLRSPQEEQ